MYQRILKHTSCDINYKGRGSRKGVSFTHEDAVCGILTPEGIFIFHICPSLNVSYRYLSHVCIR